MNARTVMWILTVAAGLCACAADPASSQRQPEPKAQLFSGMGDHKRPTSTTSIQAQAYFDQGLVWAYAFNHDEAIRSFQKAAELDPSFAMAWWGVALCNGPHINNPVMTEQRSKAAFDAAQIALRLKPGASPVERALIDSVAARYAWPAPADRRPLDEAYAAAMRTSFEQFPGDGDVAVLYAESLMDLQPWDLWTLDGQPKGQAVVIVQVLEGVLARNPSHPGAAHLYIHAVEASPSPQRAAAAADTLRQLVPTSGHLTHMPSHIDIRTGKYPAAAEANRKAIAADAAYRKLSPRQDFYRAYMQHNQQFLSFSCMMLGRSDEAIAAGKAAVQTLPAEWIRENAAVMDGYMTVYMDALKRFGRWDELIALEQPPAYLPYTTAMWRFNRGVAFAALGRIPEAQAERDRFVQACKAVPEGAIAQINPAARVLELARHVLDGEIAYARRDYPAAVAQLRDAIAIEDTLQYMEPPDWMQPARHTLGAVLLDAGRPGEAEEVYREDLSRWPDNGWALLGLARALEAQGKSAQAQATRDRQRQAWATADIDPHASCLCAPMPN